MKHRLLAICLFGLPALMLIHSSELCAQAPDGNIDGYDIRSEYPETLVWTCEEVKILMIHIGGYPPKYNATSKLLIKENHPQLFISGHSHILKVMYDDKQDCLHMNPGAAGKHGWHKVRTLIRFVIDGKDLKQCEVIELGNR